MPLSPLADENSGAPALSTSLPLRTGIGLKSQHYRQILENQPPVGFFQSGNPL
jgi:hypothetical protein